MRPILLTLFAFISLDVQAQLTVRGTVIDGMTGETLPSANISIEGTYRGTITNSDGNYTFQIFEFPATLVVRYIGYNSDQRVILENSDEVQNFSLEPAVIEMEEIVVTDKDPALSIMERVIYRKQLWRANLENYRADAYTRQSLSSDTSIVSISESVSEAFWKRGEGHREVLKSKRQTSNLSDAANFTGVSYFPNFYDDNIEIAGFDVVGPTHPQALSYYDFKILNYLRIDDQTVFEIEVIPKRKLQPTFEGVVYVLDREFAILEVKLKPNRVVNFPPPIQEFDLYYEQQFNNFGGEFWLPVDMRIQGTVRIAMVGLRFPAIKFSQISQIDNYQVNTELPDTLFQRRQVFSVDSVSIKDEQLIESRVENVPLTLEEEKAYAEIDSSATLDKAFRPEGFLARMIIEEENGSNDSMRFGAGAGFLGKIIPAGFGFRAHYNRVDGFHLGTRYRRNFFNTRTTLFGGYNFYAENWDYGISANRLMWSGSRKRLWADAEFSTTTATRYESLFFPAFANSVAMLIGSDDYFDYYRTDRFSANIRYRNISKQFELEGGFRNEVQRSADGAVMNYSLLGLHSDRRPNPRIDDGVMRSVILKYRFNYSDPTYGISGRRHAEISLEHSDSWLNSEFNFNRVQAKIEWNTPTFYQRRLFPNTFDVQARGGFSTGTLPLQRYFAIDGVPAAFSPFGVLRTKRNVPYEGDHYWLLVAEHNFRSLPFELLGLWGLADKGLGIIVFGGAGKSWVDNQTVQDLVNNFGYVPRISNGVHSEVGVSLNSIFGIARLDFAKRIDAPGFYIGISLPRYF